MPRSVHLSRNATETNYINIEYYYMAVRRYAFYLRVVKTNILRMSAVNEFCLLYSRILKPQVSITINFRSIMLKIRFIFKCAFDFGDLLVVFPFFFDTNRQFFFFEQR